MKIQALLLCALLPACAPAAARLPPASSVPEAAWPAPTRYHHIEVQGYRIFYREAGDPQDPTLVLLHGFPSSSHTYRELIPLLSGRYHVIAADYLGSGLSDRPDPAEEAYTFDRLAEVQLGLLDALGLDEYVLYMQDFGAPVGFRVAMARPERLRGLIVQNANAYLDGLTPARQAFFRGARADRSPDAIARLHAHVSAEAILHRQYLRDVGGDTTRISPDAWIHDLAGLRTEADRAIQVQLFQDYASNLDAYPQWQAFLRKEQPPTLIVWGANDAAFLAAGAEAYLRDLPDAEVHLLDAGHFAVEEQPVAIAQHITRFLEALPP